MLFDRTIRRELARTFGGTLVVLLTIVLTLGLVRTVGAAAQGVVSPQDVLLLLGYAGMSQLSTLLALSLFIAVVHCLGRIWRDSEMVIWNGAGVGLSRFLRPVLRMAWLVVLAIWALVFLVGPWVNEQSTELKQRYLQRSDLSRVTPGVFQSSRDGRSVFFIERDRDVSSEARSVFILTEAQDRESLTTSQTGRVDLRDDGRWLVLETGHRHDRRLSTGETVRAEFGVAEVRIGEGSAAATEERPPKARPTLELLLNPSRPAHGELAWRIGLALAAPNLLLLGVGLSASNPRKPNNWSVLLALLTFVLYFNLVNLTQSWVQVGHISLGQALAGLHGGVLVLAVLLLLGRDQVLQQLFRRAPR